MFADIVAYDIWCSDLAGEPNQFLSTSAQNKMAHPHVFIKI